jgi:hypothetical protein
VGYYISIAGLLTLIAAYSLSNALRKWWLASLWCQYQQDEISCSIY